MRRTKAGRYVDPRSPRGYYFDLSHLADPRGPVDAHGLPLLRRPSSGHVHSPLVVARYALGNLETYLASGREDRRDRFERAARHLIESIEVVPSSFGGWAMPPSRRSFGALLPSGRFAAGAQGECLSTIVRAWLLLGTDGAPAAARTAFATFATPVEDGGFLREVGDAGGDAGLDSLAFLEEYPIADRPVMDLSGHVRGLLGVYDYWKASNDPSAGSLWERCVRGLEFVVERFDAGYWTRDDLDARSRAANVSTERALAEHVLHLSALTGLTGSELLRGTEQRWRSYAENPVCRARALCARLTFALAG